VQDEASGGRAVSNCRIRVRRAAHAESLLLRGKPLIFTKKYDMFGNSIDRSDRGIICRRHPSIA
jgi:hypothetical protein|tara:strand:+ start:299 stop:490 length:192 start_codon:yes stop_codon:yes gene_type:complete